MEPNNCGNWSAGLERDPPILDPIYVMLNTFECACLTKKIGPTAPAAYHDMSK